MCPSCGTLAAAPREYAVAAGTGEVYSYVVHHHPPVPGKKLPIVIALVRLAEGVRMTGELLGVAPDQVRIGLPVRAEFVRVGDDLTLPAWRPLSSVTLPPLVLDVTPTFVVASALATRDFQDVHRRPVTLAEHQESRWIAEPLRLLDCCQESDGAVAIVVTSLDRARDLPRRPAVIAAAAQGSGPGQYIMTSYYRDDLAALPEIGVVAGQLWRQAGLGPADVRTAVLYDHFTPYVLIQLEELGFCARGEARGFIADGAIEVGGRLPLNTHGGQLGEAYIHGMNGIAEAVRQLRGTSVNQVPGDGPVLVTAGTGVPTSGLILS
jgi:hypothetical protein